MPEPQLQSWTQFNKLLRLNNMSLTQLAELSGFSLSYLCDLRKGRRKPSANVIDTLSRVLDVPKSMLEPRAEAAA